MVRRKNVPIDEPYHDELKRISILDKVSMKRVIEKWIERDGRGKLTLAPKVPGDGI